MIWREMEWVSLRPERFVISRMEDLRFRVSDWKYALNHAKHVIGVYDGFTAAQKAAQQRLDKDA